MLEVNLGDCSSFCGLLLEVFTLSDGLLKDPDFLPNSLITSHMTGAVGNPGSDGRWSGSSLVLCSLSVGLAGGSGGGPGGLNELASFFKVKILGFEFPSCFFLFV